MRYQNKKIAILEHPYYQKFLEERDAKKIQYYELNSGNLHYPDSFEMKQLDIVSYIWENGDNFANLAYEFYNKNPEYWWVIAFFNQKPLDQLVKVGDLIYIPTPLNKILSIYKV